ncbi:hypothetical protein ND856_12730 [Leptospira bandrabouensis]|uniref:hypothetical protein n=1 Tax=Leptospira bandrabouensis TaxID=2484903 RepID=UPI00223E5007|nr:hypothetical protein [Leptospira bandrabouensis]MCW7478149.1 hypothetical protein [Leptospira bandrabouensis]MCW7485729.1 hypothetical protein [Leptospira bandrabouensis]
MTNQKRNILFVNHNWGGGTEKHVEDLVKCFREEDEFAIFFAKLTEDGIYIHEFLANGVTQSYFFRYNLEINPISSLIFKEPNTLFRLVCNIFKIDLIHFHHFLHTGNLFSVISPFEVPYVVTLHDYFSVCPTINLLNTKGVFCGACLPNSDQSDEYFGCMRKLKLAPKYLFEHRLLYLKVLKASKRIFIPSISMENYISKVFGSFPSLRVFEHGHEKLVKVDGTKSIFLPEKYGKKLKILLLGNITDHKGLKILKGICSEKKVLNFCEFELWGSTPSRIPNVIYRGNYTQETIHQILTENQYDISLQLSITAESFSYTISELVQNRIPVICFNLGAQAERILRYKAGWVIESMDKNSLILKLVELNQKRDQIDYVKKTMDVESLNSMAAMKSFYKKEYLEVMDGNLDETKLDNDFKISDVSGFLASASLEYKNKSSKFKSTLKFKILDGLKTLLKLCYFSLKAIHLKIVNRKSFIKGFRIV